MADTVSGVLEAVIAFIKSAGQLPSPTFGVVA